MMAHSGTVGLLKCLALYRVKVRPANKALTGRVSHEARPVSHVNNLPVKSILTSHIFPGSVLNLNGGLTPVLKILKLLKMGVQYAKTVVNYKVRLRSPV